jgi:hypothetical protein
MSVAVVGKERRVRSSVVALLLVAAAIGAAAGFPIPASAQGDLEALMTRALARRDDNWMTLQRYSVDETERIDVRAADNMPVWGERRVYAWSIRDGYFIRTPVQVNGVTLSAGERRQAEAEYLQRAIDRDTQGARGEDPTKAAVSTDVGSMVEQSRHPEIMRSAIFLRFKFEDGRYSFVGHDTFEGLDVLRIEYYPERLLTREQARGLLPQRGRGAAQQEQQKEKDAAIAGMINKASLITILVEPKSAQIVQYVFDNVSLGFLPASELVRVQNLKASMTMNRPVKDAPDVWLPRDVDFYFDAMIASGSLDARYQLSYTNYQLRQKTEGARQR